MEVLLLLVLLVLLMWAWVVVVGMAVLLLVIIILSSAPPGRLPMVVEGRSLEERGEGDLGGLEQDRGGASSEGSWGAGVLYEGVWLRDET